MFAEFDQENPTNPTLIIITCAHVIASFGFMAFFMIIGMNLDIRFTNEYDIVWYWTHLLLHIPVVCHMRFECPRELCEARNVNVNRQIESKYHVTSIAGLSSSVQMFIYALLASFTMWQIQNAVRTSCDYSSVIYYKITTILQYVYQWIFSLYSTCIMYILCILQKTRLMQSYATKTCYSCSSWLNKRFKEHVYQWDNKIISVFITW